MPHCPSCGVRIDFDTTDGSPVALLDVAEENDDAPTYRAWCPAHGAVLFQFEHDQADDGDQPDRAFMVQGDDHKPGTCPKCGAVDSIVGRVDLQWNGTAWAPVIGGDFMLECTSCDGAFYPAEAGLPDLPDVALVDDDGSASFTISCGHATAETMAEELERVADMLRDGFTSGESVAPGGGWWNVCDLTEELDEVED